MACTEYHALHPATLRPARTPDRSFVACDPPSRISVANDHRSVATSCRKPLLDLRSTSHSSEDLLSVGATAPSPRRASLDFRSGGSLGNALVHTPYI